MNVKCVLCLVPLLGLTADACTTVVVGKQASATGRVIVGHNEDASSGCSFVRHDVARTPSALAHFWLEARDEAGRHSPVCDAYLNERGVLVVSNNALCEPCADKSKLTEGGVLGEVRKAVAERAKSAREAVDVITNLVSTYGYRDPGRIYTVADADEAWQVTVVYGKRFVARRCPDDKVTMTANCCTVRTFEQGDILSPDFAKEPSGFDFAKACQQRGKWNSQHYLYRWRHLTKFFSGRDWKGGDCPFAVAPSRKIDARAVQEALSSHYEGTPDEIPAGADGRRHDESVRTGICRESNLHSSVWSFGDAPADIRLDLAAGSPCCHPYKEEYPLRAKAVVTTCLLSIEIRCGGDDTRFHEKAVGVELVEVETGDTELPTPEETLKVKATKYTVRSTDDAFDVTPKEVDLTGKKEASLVLEFYESVKSSS